MADMVDARTKEPLIQPHDDCWEFMGYQDGRALIGPQTVRMRLVGASVTHREIYKAAFAMGESDRWEGYCR